MEGAKFNTLAAAFQAMSPELQAHSARVEQYADLIFTELCAAEEYLGNTKSRVRLKMELLPLVREAARYHDLGKALVPAFYQWNSPAYSPEEQALYKKHCADGAAMLEPLLLNEPGTTPTRVQVITEAVIAHHERWDGKGWPMESAGENTPVIGRIVAAADALDHLLMNAHSETPVDTALDQFMEGSGTRFDPIIAGLTFEAKRKLEKLFAPYAGISRAIPKATRVIRRKSKRPFFLQYRPITALADKSLAALEADMRFRRGKDLVDYPQVEHLVKANKNAQELGLAFLLEACDMRRRLAACEVGGSYIALNCVTGLLRKRGAASAIAKLMADTDSDPAGICLILTSEDWESDAFALKENCQKLAQQGFSLMVSGVALEALSLEKLKELAVTHVRLPAMEQEALEAGVSRVLQLHDAGLTLLAEGLDTYRIADLLRALSVDFATGLLCGEYTEEDELITLELAVKRS